MPHVVLPHCCADARCVAVCPVDCLHPAPGEPGFAETDMLHIDPDTCIDCGACADVCPFDAVVTDYSLPRDSPVIALNLAWPSPPDRTRVRAREASPARVVADGPLRVAVVGAGPAGVYVADRLTDRRGPARAREVAVTVYERLPVAGGLARFGVAPDHHHTRRVIDTLDEVLRRPRVRLTTGSEIGVEQSVEDLLTDHHAVVYAAGAPADRVLGIPGEDRPGSYSAGTVVRWYTGHPDAAEVHVRTDTSRAVVIGNGNVALDVARLFRAGADVSGCAPAARAALSRGTIRRVDVVARGGPERAAFTTSELLSLLEVADLRVSSDARPEQLAGLDPTRRRLLEALPAPTRDPGPTRPEVALRFGLTPTAVHGGPEVESVTFEAADGTEHVLRCGLLVRAVGFRGRAMPGVPFDDERGVVPNDRGRVAPGLYVAGWAKRGPSGQLGHNRTCAAETVDRLLEDHAAGLLSGRRV